MGRFSSSREFDIKQNKINNKGLKEDTDNTHITRAYGICNKELSKIYQKHQKVHESKFSSKMKI